MAVEEGVADDYTQDGTVDLKGNPVRRSKRGGWKACSFIIGISLISLVPSPNASLNPPFRVIVHVGV